MKMKDWVGRYVRLNRQIESKGGRIFPKGELMQVSGHWRGKLNLDRPARAFWTPEHGGAQLIRGVSKHEVDLLPADPEACIRVALDGIRVMAESMGMIADFTLNSVRFKEEVSRDE